MLGRTVLQSGTSEVDRQSAAPLNLSEHCTDSSFRRRQDACSARKALCAIRILTFLVASVFFFGFETVRTSAEDQFRLIVPSTIIAEPETETLFAVQVEPRVKANANLLLRVVGLHGTARFTSGYRISEKAWALPIVNAQPLRIVLSATAPQKQDLRLLLVSIDGHVFSEVRTTVEVRSSVKVDSSAITSDGTNASEVQTSPREPSTPDVAIHSPSTAAPNAVPSTQPSTELGSGTASAQGQASGAATKSQPETPAEENGKSPVRNVPKPRELSSADRNRAERFLARGEALRAQGQIVQARLFYRRAAEIGLAPAALALGATFDPRELNRVSVVGVAPDIEQARYWYKLAEKLGSELAKTRLSQLRKQ